MLIVSSSKRKRDERKQEKEKEQFLREKERSEINTLELLFPFLSFLMMRRVIFVFFPFTRYRRDQVVPIFCQSNVQTDAIVRVMNFLTAKAHLNCTGNLNLVNFVSFQHL